MITKKEYKKANKIVKGYKKQLELQNVMQSKYTPDMISKHLDWDSYDHMKINEEHIEPKLKECINMIFYLCELEVPFYYA